MSHEFLDYVEDMQILHDYTAQGPVADEGQPGPRD